MQPVWKGPIEGGITQSLISNFIGNPYNAFIYYGLGLEEPTVAEPNLFWGNGFHKGLEIVLPTGIRIKNLSPETKEEVFQEIKKDLRKDFPDHPSTYPYTITRMLDLYDDSYTEGKVIKTEQKFSVPYQTKSGTKCTLRGKADVLCPGEFIAEHKCKGKIDSEQTRVETPFDLQTLLYCYVFKVNKVYYDLIRIPEAQWSQPNYSALAKAEGKAKVMFETASKWNDWPIVPNKHLWIRQIPLDIPQENIQAMLDFTLDPIIDYIWCLYDMWCNPAFDHNDPKWYNALFYKTPIRQFDATRTEKYKCKNHSFLTGQLGLNEMIPVTSFYKELDDE